MTPDPQLQWQETRQQTVAAAAAFARDYAMSAEQEQQILKQRALELGRTSVGDANQGHGQLDLVEFQLAGEHYAFPLAQVREVCRLRELTAVPCTPKFILGIINLRGEILTIVNLKSCFDLPDSVITEDHKILILHGGGNQMGILADSIHGVRRLLPDELQPALPTLTGLRADYLTGITHDCMVVLDAAKLLADHRLVVDEEPPS